MSNDICVGNHHVIIDVIKKNPLVRLQFSHSKVTHYQNYQRLKPIVPLFFKFCFKAILTILKLDYKKGDQSK